MPPTNPERTVRTERLPQVGKIENTVLDEGVGMKVRLTRASARCIRGGRRRRVLVTKITAGLAASFAVVSMTSSTSAIAEPEPLTDVCSVSVSFPQPPPGFKVVQPHEVNPFTCEIIAGEVELVPLTGAEEEQANTSEALTPVTQQAGSLASGFAAAAGCGEMHTRSLVKDNDKANILINAVKTDSSWCWDGAVVTSYNSGGIVEWHREFPTGGWRAENVFNVVASGCAGCDHARIHAHADFSYQGVFDPTGTRYYNHLNNWPRLNGNGSWACELYVDFKNKPNDIPGVIRWFTWHPSCF